MSRTEPDLPSIHTPLAHESAITTDLARTSIDTHNSVAAQLASHRTTTTAPTPGEPPIPAPAAQETLASATAGKPGALERAPIQLDQDPEISPEPLPAPGQAASEMLDEQLSRAWPGARHREPPTPEPTDDRATRGHDHGWAP
jgi:hypothetical protein